MGIPIVYYYFITTERAICFSHYLTSKSPLNQDISNFRWHRIIIMKITDPVPFLMISVLLGTNRSSRKRFAAWMYKMAYILRNITSITTMMSHSKVTLMNSERLWVFQGIIIPSYEVKMIRVRIEPIAGYFHTDRK